MFEISVSPKAKGQECLDLVCDRLNIIEVDFFGLQYECNGYWYWLNLRNPIRQQSQCQKKPLRYHLKVKFHVLPYEIRQSATRHLFYLDIRNRIKNRELKVSDTAEKAKLISLIAQIEFGDYREDCYDLTQFYTEWILNLCGKRRNKDDITTETMETATVTTKELKLVPNIESKIRSINQLSAEYELIYKLVIEYHQLLSGYQRSEAEQHFLKDVSLLDDIGTNYFNARILVSGRSTNPKCKIGLGVHGVTIRQEEKRIINYNALVKMIVSNKVFLLMHVNDSGDIVEEKFQFNSTKLAQAVYRETTEKRVFYHCDTVGDSVATQCIRGFADMFMSIAPSIFINANGGDNVNGSSLHGKNYVFDIRRTLRQFQDDIQRTMFKLNTIFNAGLSQDTITDCDTTQSVTEQSTDQENEEKILCRICMDRPVDLAFIPCHHMISCGSCGSDCDSCPICRTPIIEKSKIFY